MKRMNLQTGELGVEEEGLEVRSCGVEEIEK
jgi:hypothetical protein